MYLRFEPYIPRTKQVFWCKHCDWRKVDSTDEVTGRFFVVAGHSFDNKKMEYDGDYHAVMFAVCALCLQDQFRVAASL